MPAIKKDIRVKVHKKYGGHCAYCGKVIAYKEMQVDHIHPQWMRGSLLIKGQDGLTDQTDSFDNLNPSCRRCNHYKRASMLEDFRKRMLTLHARIADYYITRVGIDYGMVTITPFDGVFYFERTKPF